MPRIDLGGLVSRGVYVAANVLGRPGKAVFDRYFARFPDVYRMEENGDARFLAIAGAIERHVGPIASILDVSCHEGYGLALLANRLGVHRVEGLDISDVVLERARHRLKGFDAALRQFDLRELYEYPNRTLPATPADVVIVSEVLYQLGHYWRRADKQVARKVRMVKALQAHARKAVIFQHFGQDVREPIGAIIEQCGGRLIPHAWGLYLLPAS